MFAAALLDAWPDLFERLDEALARTALGGVVALARHPHNDGILSGSRFAVTPAAAGHHHRSYADVRRLLDAAGLRPPVLARAQAMFALLADAEAEVHGIEPAAVQFHEVGAWDSLADVVSAAWLIDWVHDRPGGPASWSCAPLPIGGGRVKSAHGDLSVPAPATALLLRGFLFHDDGRAGERVTPTGAAILRHLQPAARPLPVPMRLARQGTGFGTRELAGMSNVLRVLVFETPAGTVLEETLEQVSFEVDDQSPEDLAVAVERLRERAGVLEVIQVPVQAKKGRLAVQVQLLCRPQAAPDVVAACFDETTTLGLRCQAVQRVSLARESYEAQSGAERLRVKQARRPGGAVTRKVEMDDLAGVDGGHAARETVRREAEARPCAGAAETDDA